jgi:hypothetical protein
MASVTKFEPFEIEISKGDDVDVDDQSDHNPQEAISSNDLDDTNHSGNSFEDLLPPSKLYVGNANNIDADLDALLEIDMDEVKLLKKKEKLRFLKKNTRKLKRSCCSWCSCFKLGRTNIRVLHPKLYANYKLGVIGPHWCGVLTTVALLYSASYYFTRKAYDEIGIVSAAICCIFTISATVNLFLVSCKDPGVVRNAADCQFSSTMAMGIDNEDDRGEYAGLTQSQTKEQGEEEGWRYCVPCKVYQPPSAAHCPDCNACVEEFDHHCPWMGICIGKGNYRAFMAFNLSWLMYLIYAAAWVTALGPRYFDGK